MILISLLFLIFIFSIQTIEATGPKDLNPAKTKAEANLSQSSAASGAKNKIDLKKDPAAETKKLSLKEKKALLKKIILEDIVSATPLSEADRELIQNQEGFDRENSLIKGFKISVQDNQLKPDGLLSSVFNKKTLDGFFNQYLFMENIQSHMERNNKKLYGKGRGYLKNINQEQGEAEILIYLTESLRLISLKELIIDNLANCRDLEETEVQALKTPEAKAEGIYDGKYISNACQIDIEDELLKTTAENEIEKLFDIYFKQEIADQLNKPNLNLDKHMSVYLKMQDMTKGRIGVILADTKREKKSALIEALKNHLNNSTDSDINKRAIEEAYGVEYINLGITLFSRDDRVKSGQEFDKSFALIDEILNTNTEIRTAWIDRANKYRRSVWYIQQAIPNDSNTILRSLLNPGDYNFGIDFFTLSESPKGAIQSNILDWIDIRIANVPKFPKYESIRSSDAIKGFEKGKSLKQGLKFNEIYEARFNGGSLSSYFDNAKEFNPLLDDEDFKRKVITKINDYQENNQKFKETIDFVFSRDNLENIKIKAQNFRDGGEFELVVYELEPLEESDPTNPSADESAEPAADGESDESAEPAADGESDESAEPAADANSDQSPVDGESPVDGD